MKQKTIDEYIVFGTELRFLVDAQEGFLIFGKECILENIDRFLSNISSLNFQVVERMCDDLKSIREKFSEKPLGSTLSQEDAKELSQATQKLHKTILAESAGKIAYVLTEKRWTPEKLIDDIGSLFSENVYKSLSPLAQHDFKEAGKCIAFALPTAAAFHILRGTEEVFKNYYFSLVKTKTRRVSPLTWGNMLSHLEKIKKRKRIPQELLDNLSSINKNYRNETQHPIRIYNMEEAQDLLPLCIDVINRVDKSSKVINGV